MVTYLLKKSEQYFGKNENWARVVFCRGKNKMKEGDINGTK